MRVNLESRGTFCKNNLTKVVFGSGIETIGEYAFYGSSTTNKITEVDFSKSENLKTIRHYAFANNQITSLNLNVSNNLQTIK